MAGDNDELETLADALIHLKESDVELLRLVYWQELTYREIALELGISENAVGIRINRAKKNLRNLLPPADIASVDDFGFEEGLG
jgi:RNA polymerase sigma-70 factor (ECF subfamily)